MNADELRAHLVDEHHMPADVLDQHTPAEHVIWHEAEHRTRTYNPKSKTPRHAGHLKHRHKA